LKAPVTTSPTTATGRGNQLLDLAAVRTAVEQRLTQLFQEKIAVAGKIDPVYVDLLGEIANITAHPGGKRLRPYLTYLAYVGYGSQDTAAIIDVATSQELYHSFLLIHDDVIDRDTLRHGRPNIGGRYRQRLAHLGTAEAAHYADSMAILAGDIQSGLMFELITRSSFSDAQKVAVIQRLTQSMFEIVGGEVLDVLLPLEAEPQLDRRRILQVMQYKTASYSFSTPLQIGAMLAGASAEQLTAIDSVAIPLGVAFQITDDLLGMFGDERQTGKPATSDLEEGKHTLLMAHGLALADAAGRATLQRHLGHNELDPAGHAEVVAVLEACGAAAKTRAEAAGYITTAQRNLSKLGLTPAATKALEELTAFVIKRSK
jgi:geranylgeranyl diphosphate synthase, type I